MTELAKVAAIVVTMDNHYHGYESIDEARARYCQGDCHVIALAEGKWHWHPAGAPDRPAPLAWTREKPTEPGWYWIRLQGRVYTKWASDRTFWPDGAERAGPIPEPQESQV